MDTSTQTITLADGSSVAIPALEPVTGAAVVALTTSAFDPQYLQEAVVSDEKLVADFNGRRLVDWNNEVKGWLGDAAQNRSLGIALPPKPTAWLTRVLHFFFDRYGSLYKWVADDGPVIGTCPDLPPLVVTLPQGVQHIGISLDGMWFSVGEGDTMPNNATAPGVSADGISGLFKRVWGFGSGGTQGGGGWYQKIG